MKNILTVFAFLFIGIGSAYADNGGETGDPKKEEKEKTYEVSISKSYFSFFNIFSIETIKSDTLDLVQDGKKATIARIK